MAIGISDIQKAREKIGKSVLRTRLEHARTVSELVGSETYLKFENEQKTGSFKIRGALNKMMSLTDEEKRRGVVAASAGNHAQGVASGAAMVGTQARIVMPKISPLTKIAATKSYGGEVILHGEVFDEAYAHARELEKQQGYVFVHPYDDPLVMAGQGTIGLEILEDLADVESIIIPIGGGGLISGVATAIKTQRPSCKIYGVVAANASGMRRMFQKESLENKPVALTIADGIAVKNPSASIYKDYISRLVDDIVEVNESEIAASIVYLLERAKTVVEGSGAVALAAAKKGGLKLGKKCVLLLSGGNIDMNMVAKVIEKGLSRNGRIARLSVVVDDRPGALSRLTHVIADQGANILEVKHDRLGPQVGLRETAIEFLLETQSDKQIQSLVSALSQAGARFPRPD